MSLRKYGVVDIILNIHEALWLITPRHSGLATKLLDAQSPVWQTVAIRNNFSESVPTGFRVTVSGSNWVEFAFSLLAKGEWADANKPNFYWSSKVFTAITDLVRIRDWKLGEATRFVASVLVRLQNDNISVWDFSAKCTIRLFRVILNYSLICGTFFGQKLALAE